jgi:hypothetical protein
MKIYDPEIGPSSAEWLAIDEAERIVLVESYHRRRHIRVPQLTLHAPFMLLSRIRLLSARRW